MRGALFALAQTLLFLALLWPKADVADGDAGAYIPADWGAGFALALLYAAVLLGVMALWARRWKLRPPTPATAESDASWMRGPYRFVRHPMRLALIAAALGWCLVYRAPENGLLLAAYVLVALLDARRADRALAVGGGARVQAWLGRVRAFVPGLY